MKIINSNPEYDPVNNGFMYICGADDGTLWIRSVIGSWVEITTLPVDTGSLDVDFQVFIAKNTPATPAQLIQDNSGKNVVAPVDLVLPDDGITTGP